MTVWVAADPGLSGGICVIDGRKRAQVYPMPVITIGRRKTHDWVALAALIKASNPSVIIVEEVTRPSKLVRHQGFILGVGYGIPVDVATVRPQAWKKWAGLPVGATKDDSIAKCLEMFPYLSDSITKKSHDGLAEAHEEGWPSGAQAC
jgi:hypothetical protein